ncbi:hypothetical protein [Paradesulfitobacterium ferrireducens]|uniref:hypothetical protein n=1 Tax=Paradesulfitobacterium ferrireducens TaxID=2816476 RepID=UPI001A8F0E3E|nr:hypothetical protein [Paradesulfitobacterium ferrireducens]
MAVCALCRRESDLKEDSHIIPKFVYSGIKRNSPFGFLRESSNPDLRIQDGDKQLLLCEECEDRFSVYERHFSMKVFQPYQAGQLMTIEYGPWLNYFITSVNWRNLYLDLCGFVESQGLSVDALSVLIETEELMRNFLLDRRPDLGGLENHIFIFDQVKEASEEFKRAGPHSFFRSSAYGYTFISHTHQGYYVYSNLAGILIFTLLKKSSFDQWIHTRVWLCEGKIETPQTVISPVMGDVIDYFLEHKKRQMSEKQQEKLVKEVKKHPEKLLNSKYFEFCLMDKELK